MLSGYPQKGAPTYKNSHITINTPKLERKQLPPTRLQGSVTVRLWFELSNNTFLILSQTLLEATLLGCLVDLVSPCSIPCNPYVKPLEKPITRLLVESLSASSRYSQSSESWTSEPRPGILPLTKVLLLLDRMHHDHVRSAGLSAGSKRDDRRGDCPTC